VLLNPVRYKTQNPSHQHALKWVGYLDQAMQHAKASDVLIAQHHWPVWGNDNSLIFSAISAPLKPEFIYLTV
jgi:alkyl sulfatase BDS1-like metallo-beta-lactamase superfamily hydrolase